jgi:membrane fusion protein (multidrug efflux system)
VVPNPDFTLRPGMFVTAVVFGTRRPNAIIVPQVAVQQTAQGQIVWLVNDEGEAEARPVKTGDWIGDGWLVETGLNGGESLVVQGFQRLRPGVPVKAVPYRPEDGGDPAGRTAGG